MDGVRRGRTAWTLPGRDGPVHLGSHCRADTRRTLATFGMDSSRDRGWTPGWAPSGHLWPGCPSGPAWVDGYRKVSPGRRPLVGCSHRQEARWTRPAAGPAAAPARPSSRAAPAPAPPRTSRPRTRGPGPHHPASRRSPRGRRRRGRRRPPPRCRRRWHSCAPAPTARATRPPRRWRRGSGGGAAWRRSRSARSGRSWCLCAAGRTRGRPR
jgi:hypothetical protein